MLKALQTLVSNIEQADEISVDLVPVELVDVFEKYYSPKLGALMLGMRKQSLNLNFTKVPVRNYQQAFSLVKASESQEEKIIYSLHFLGMFNKAANDGVKQFIGQLLGKG